MDLVGEFYKVETNGKLFLIYHNTRKPLPQIHTPNSSTKVVIYSGDEDLPHLPLFVCPVVRIKRIMWTFARTESDDFLKVESSPLFVDTSKGHHVLPLYWCNNTEIDPEEECYACMLQTIGTDYYFCVECDKRFHKECIESPPEIAYPSHLKHSLQLYYSPFRSDDYCIYCKERAAFLVYYCALCNIYMHPLCAQTKIPYFIDQQKRHDHTLTLFPRLASLACNICALVTKYHLTYICSTCNFLVHRDCIDIPQTIRISRHYHRVSFTPSLPLVKWSCGVCRREIDIDYGVYTCNVCSGYAVHTKCALREDIWDGIELDGVPEDEEDEEEEEVVEPFERISVGIVLHFSHGHHLKFEKSRVYDGNKFCQACVLQIYEGNFYECVECDFILHETCAEAPRKKFHPLHPHPLQLATVHKEGFFLCGACSCVSNGFLYMCSKRNCDYQLDLRCAFVCEPFKYQGHQHSLFLALDPKEKPMCHFCKSDRRQVLNCIECEYIICFRCATLPYMVRYKHDKHYLTLCLGDEARDSDWCELCEGKLAIGGEKGFYKCDKYCCTTLHISCLLGDDPYMKPGQSITSDRGPIDFFRNNSASRPICQKCDIRCPYPVFLKHYKETVICSLDCLYMFR